MRTNRSNIFVGQNLLHFPTLPSTNAFASQLLAKSRPPEGTVISTYHQSDGRGQFGTTWESEAGSHLAFTTILYPSKVPAREQFVLTRIAALAVLDLVRSLGPGDSKVKWPNDIYLNGRKVAGILIQNTLSGPQIQHGIIGIGLNVNQPSFPDYLPHATSLYLETGSTFQLEEMRDRLCETLEQRYLQSRTTRATGLAEEYLENLFRKGEHSRFRFPDGAESGGVILGVTPTGQLRVQFETGETRSFQLKEIELIL